MAAAARERAITIARRVPRTSTHALMPDYNHLARLYTLQGKRAEGRSALGTALTLVREDRDLLEPTRTGMIAEILGNLALIDALEEKYAAAEQKYRRVLNLLGSLDDATETRIARLHDYARVLRKMGRADEASAIERQAASLASTVIAP